MIVRIWHPWTVWECYRAGFYNSLPPDRMTPEGAKAAYRDFLRDNDRFNEAITGVFHDWPHSCEHFLTNIDMNRIAWIGQSSMCYATGIPSCFRGGFKLLTPAEQRRANTTAAIRLQEWEEAFAKKNRRVHRDLENKRVSRRHTGRSSPTSHAGGISAELQGNLFRYLEK